MAEPYESTEYQGMVDFHWSAENFAEAKRLAETLKGAAQHPELVLQSTGLVVHLNSWFSGGKQIPQNLSKTFRGASDGALECHGDIERADYRRTFDKKASTAILVWPAGSRVRCRPAEVMY